jgi:hypothetical protein
MSSTNPSRAQEMAEGTTLFILPSLPKLLTSNVPGRTYNRHVHRVSFVHTKSADLSFSLFLCLLAYIDSATSYISTSVDSDAQTEKICDTMFTTVASFFPPHEPPLLLQPAEPQPDDRERVMDRQVFYDEPPMQALIASLDEPSRLFLQEAAERERERLPLFPAHFKMFWEGHTGSSEKGDSALCFFFSRGCVD